MCTLRLSLFIVVWNYLLENINCDLETCGVTLSVGCCESVVLSWAEIQRRAEVIAAYQLILPAEVQMKACYATAV